MGMLLLYPECAEGCNMPSCTLLGVFIIIAERRCHSVRRYSKGYSQGLNKQTNRCEHLRFSYLVI